MSEFSLEKYENRSVLQSNPLTEACKAMELYEGKLYYLALLEFNFRQDNIDGNVPLPELIIPTDVVIKVFGGNKSYYKRLKDAAASLYDISFARTDDGKILLAAKDSDGLIDMGNGVFSGERIFTSMKFSPREGGLKFRFSENIKSEIHKLFIEKGFTLITGKTLFSLSSMYAIRLIEMLLRQQNLEINKKRGYIKIKRNIQELRLDLSILHLATYNNSSNIKLKILNPAREDINTNTAYKLDYEDIKNGRKIIGFEFKLYYPDNNDTTINEPTAELINERAQRRAKEINITANVDNPDANIIDVLKFYGVGKIVAKRIAADYSDKTIRDNIRYCIDFCSTHKIKKTFAGLLKSAIEEDYASNKEQQQLLFQPTALEHKGDGRQLTEAEQRAADKMNAFWYGDKPKASTAPQNEPEPEEAPVAVKPSPAPEPEPTPEDKDRLSVSIDTIKLFVDSGKAEKVERELAKLAKKGISIDDVRALNVEELEARYEAAEAAESAPEQEPEKLENIPDPEPSATPEPNIFELEIKPEHEAKKAEDKRIYADDYAVALEAIRAKVAKLNLKELQIIKDSVEKDKPAGMMIEMRLQQLDLNAYDAYLVVDEFLQSK